MSLQGLCRTVDAALGLSAAPGDEIFRDDWDDVDEADWIEAIARLDELTATLEASMESAIDEDGAIAVPC